MHIASAAFIKGVVEADEILEDDYPQIAFIGRSNVGKSSLINALTGVNGLAKTSSFPGRTREINLFMVNKKFIFVDLPGYGFAQGAQAARARLKQLIQWYLLDSHYQQRFVVLIIDANVGMTKDDIAMLKTLTDKGKNVIVVANKVDKIKKSHYPRQLQAIKDLAGECPVVPFSAHARIGISDLTHKLLSV